MLKEVLIPVRDGTTIGAAVYAPETSGRFPALLAASPYRYDNNVLPAGPQFLWRETGPIEFYVKQGYAYVHMDVRGCGKSGGEFELLGPNEQNDLYDVVEWIARQPWSNGKVGMIGMSYQAVTQWWAASLAPPHLAAIVPQVSPPDWFENLPYQNGVLTSWFMNWSARMSGRTIQPNTVANRGGMAEVFQHTPYIDINAFLGMASAPWFQEMYRQNKSTDPYWQGILFQSREGYSKIQVPSLAFGGWFDVNHPGTPMNYLEVIP
jgi:putative CocE/NonD family hydrolase